MSNNKELITHLDRIFPKLEMYMDGEEDGDDYYPPYDVDWWATNNNI